MILCSNAFGQDTTLIDVGTYDVNLGNGKHVMVIGDAEIYRDAAGVLKRGKWEPKDDVSGTFTMSIKEDLTIRASKNPAGYRVEKKGKYIEFWLMTNVFKRFNATTLTKVHRGFRWTIADGSYYQVNVSRGKIKETIYSIGKRNKFNVLINTNINRIGRVFERFQILQLTAEDSTGKALAISDSFIVRNDSTFFQAKVDTAGAKFPIMVDPTIVVDSLSNRIEETIIGNYNAGAMRNDGGGQTYTDAFQFGGAYTHKQSGLMKFKLNGFSSDTMQVDSCRLTLKTVAVAGSVADSIYAWYIPRENFGWAEGTGTFADTGTTDYACWSWKKYHNRVRWANGDSGANGIIGKGWNISQAFGSVIAGYNPLKNGDSLVFYFNKDTVEAHLGDSIEIFIQNPDSIPDAVSYKGVRIGTTENAVDSLKPVLRLYYTKIGGSATQYAGRAMGRILNTPRGKELDAVRNPGMITNEVYRKD